jgi:hypothetical protein
VDKHNALPFAVAKGGTNSLDANKGCKPMPSATSDAVSDEVMIRRYRDCRECDVIVVFRGREMVVRLPNHEQALKWARMECKVYQIPEHFLAQANEQVLQVGG